MACRFRRCEPGSRRIDHIQVLAQFIGGARLAGIIAGGGDPAAQFAAGVFKAADIVALPAVQADGNFFQAGEGFFGIHAQGGVAFFGEVVGGLDLRFSWHGCSSTYPPAPFPKGNGCPEDGG